ncbi:MAG: hypothetical protein KJT03_00150 [Verrucomicrobiae bacterium]|nr:hypothetical protein [Verrucomicrobiae bacterium]
MLRGAITTILLCTAFAAWSAAATLKPRMVELDQLVLAEDFNQPAPLDNKKWQPRQHTRWSIEDGVLRGIPSTQEYQASRKDHQGFEPRLSIPSCPQEFAIEFSIRFVKGEQTPLCPFIEFGHHVGRIYWNEDGAALLADHESVQLDSNSAFKLESGKWYHGLAEIKGDEMLITFEHGPFFYGKHPGLAVKKDGFGVAGFSMGTVELDNIQVWSVKSGTNPDWKNFRTTFATKPPKVLKPEIADKS